MCVRFSLEQEEEEEEVSGGGGGEPGCRNSTALDVVPGATVVHNFQWVAVLLLLLDAFCDSVCVGWIFREFEVEIFVEAGGETTTSL